MRTDQLIRSVVGILSTKVMVAVLMTAFFIVGACQRTSPPEPAPPAAQTASATSGRDLYVKHCSACHGENGDGKGLAARFLFPKPRDFRAGKFRLVSTTNRVPSSEDLQTVLVHGMPGSSMPPWAHLGKQQQKLLVEEVLKLRREGARDEIVNFLKEDLDEGEEVDEEEVAEYVESHTTPGPASEVPEITAASAESIARGKEIYVTQGCNSCHGNEGKGDGQEVMIDDEGLPTRPRDLTLGIFKGNHDPASLYHRVAYGMPGTPMPASPNLTPQQNVDLVHFIRSLSDEPTRQATILRREQIVAAKVSSLPDALDAALWESVPSVGLRMTPLWWRDDPDPDLQVQAVHDGKSIALRLSWRDESADDHAARTTAFEDAVAVELYRGDAEPFVGMGDPDSPVDVWYWDADRQGTPRAVEDEYPNVVVDMYPLSETLVATAEYRRPGTKTSEQPDVSLPARASGNLIVPEAGESGASALTVGGPSTVTFRLPQSQLVKARGEWTGGRWTVVMERQLAVDSEGGVSLEPGGSASVAFAVWDGSKRDRDGKKLITIWQDLVLEP